MATDKRKRHTVSFKGRAVPDATRQQIIPLPPFHDVPNMTL